MIPNRTSLVEWPINLDSWSTGNWTRDGAVGVTVAKNTSGSEDLRGETTGDDNVVVLRWLISSDKHRVGLANMNIKWGEGSLKGVSSFNFHQLHLVSLNSKVEGILQTHIWYPKPICFPFENNIKLTIQSHVKQWMEGKKINSTPFVLLLLVRQRL